MGKENSNSPYPYNHHRCHFSVYEGMTTFNGVFKMGCRGGAVSDLWSRHELCNYLM